MKIKEVHQSVKGLVEVYLSVKLYRAHASVPRYKSLKHIVRMLLDLLIIKFIIIGLYLGISDVSVFVLSLQVSPVMNFHSAQDVPHLSTTDSWL